MSDYTAEEKRQSQVDIDNLCSAWNIFCHERENGVEGNVHMPPALFAATGRIFEEVNDGNEMKMMLPQILIDRFAEFGSVMFEFGQRAARDGVLSANMVQCKCSEVTDEEIQKLTSN
jgi:hypothetical protein